MQELWDIKEGSGSVAGGWAAASASQVEVVAWRRVAPGELEVQALPGWKAPLWRWAGGGLEILRPEGHWVLQMSRRESFTWLEAGRKGWMASRGVLVSDAAKSGVWFDQQGWPQRPEDLDEAQKSPWTLAGEVDGSGVLAKWELQDDATALAWLDDSFQSGPFTCKARRPWMVVSNGKKRIAYWVGNEHWAWAMMDRGLLRLMMGRGGGWETEAIFKPLMLE